MSQPPVSVKSYLYTLYIFKESAGKLSQVSKTLEWFYTNIA